MIKNLLKLLIVICTIIFIIFYIIFVYIIVGNSDKIKNIIIKFLEFFCDLYSIQYRCNNNGFFEIKIKEI